MAAIVGLIVTGEIIVLAGASMTVPLRIASAVAAILAVAVVIWEATVVTYPSLTVISSELEFARRSAELETEKMNAQFRALFDGSDLGMALLSPAGAILETNATLQSMLGYSEVELEAMSFGAWIHPDDLPAGFSFAESLDAEESIFQASEIRCMTKERAELWVEVKLSPVRDASSKVRLVIGILQDASRRVSAQRQLRFEADHDALTGLCNRLHFQRVLESAFEDMRRGKPEHYAVLFIDLDHFKFVNDSLGHAAGDEVLVTLGERIKSCARGHDVVARLGGDEFAVLLTNVDGRGSITKVAERIQQEIAVPIDLDGRLVYMSASIGITQGRAGYTTAEEMLRDADTAAYRAKSMGRARHVVFDQAMHAQANQRLQMSSDLSRALEEGQLRLVYQPIIDLHLKRCTGFEALCRWKHPTLGEIAPSDFIPVAEETGLIIKLGSWALREACSQLATWQRRYGEAQGMTISVNVSPQQIVQPNFDREVGRIINECGLRGQSLVLEITESVIIDGARLASSVVDGLNDLGVRLCVDDFGTGYSSLVYLERLPIDALKIDKGFVNGSNGLLQSEQIVRMVLRLGDSLKMRVIAEGVETKQQLILLNKMGARYIQGYLFSKPIDPASIESSIFSKSDMLLGADFAASRWANTILRPA